jgi:hypothetical protein
MLAMKTASLVAVFVAGGIAVALAQGSTARAAAPGLGTQVISNTFSGSGRVETRSGTVSCPAGTKVTGGGFSATYGGTQQVVENRPNGNGWHVRVLATGSITVYAICASLTE